MNGKEKSFTLLELLVVIAIIAILAGVVIASVVDLRQRAKESKGMQFSQNIRTTLSNELVGEWKFDNLTSPYIDTSDEGHNGTPINNPVMTDGKTGEALEFNGTNSVRFDNVKVNTSAGGKNTVEFWIRWDGSTNRMPIGWNLSYDLYLSSGCIGFNTANSDILGYSSAELVGNWNHIVAIFYNGVPTVNTNEIYINGEKKILNCNINSHISRSATPTVFISGWGTSTGYRLIGRMDEVRIYNRALTAYEIQKLYVQSKDRYLVDK